MATLKWCLCCEFIEEENIDFIDVPKEEFGTIDYTIFWVVYSFKWKDRGFLTNK
jgi:hypothetical protein